MRTRHPLLTALSTLLLQSHRPHLLATSTAFIPQLAAASSQTSGVCSPNDARYPHQQPLWMPAAPTQQLHDPAFAFTPNNMSTRGPVIALSHGGGPLPLIGDPDHKDIVESLRFKVPKLLRLGTPQAPRAIVLVTAHWSENKPTVSSGAKHNLEFDYYGFPDATYKLKYDAPGSPEVAKEVAQALKEVGLSPELDDFRGWDHGVFVPMLLINPQADVPIVQMSVLASESPEDHYKMGLALKKLRDSNIAIIGSGFATFHNLRLMMGGVSRQPDFRKRNDVWSEAVWDSIKETDPDTRSKKLETWREWPNAYEMHPRGGAEHFLPLLVCAGAGGNGEAKHYTDEFMGIDLYSYYWDD